MKDFVRVLKRFVPPYKKYMALNIVFHILSAILNLFSFALIIPILNILFKMDDKAYIFRPLTWDIGSWDSWKGAFDLIKNNFFAYVSHIIETEGGAFTLVVLGVFLVVMTLLKVLAMYMAFYTMIPIRTGVVRDIRNQIKNAFPRIP